MTKLLIERDLLERALKTLEVAGQHLDTFYKDPRGDMAGATIDELEVALAQPEQAGACVTCGALQADQIVKQPQQVLRKYWIVEWVIKTSNTSNFVYRTTRPLRSLKDAENAKHELEKQSFSVHVEFVIRELHTHPPAQPASEQEK